jgi:ssDNA-binding Zn-finger/Zn-ribbon topoisomerase 1
MVSVKATNFPEKPFGDDPARGKKFREELTAFLLEREFSRPVHWGWSKPLECGLLLVVSDFLDHKNASVHVEVQHPNPQSYNGLGMRVFEHNTVSLLSTTWRVRLNERLVLFAEKANAAASIKCPHCGSFMAEREVKKEGPNLGEKFYGCVHYPDCKGIRATWKQTFADDEGKRLDIYCPDCSKPLAIRYAKRGMNVGERFYGCTAYPTCQRIVSQEEAMALKMMQTGQPKPENPFDLA